MSGNEISFIKFNQQNLNVENKSMMEKALEAGEKIIDLFPPSDAEPGISFAGNEDGGTISSCVMCEEGGGDGGTEITQALGEMGFDIPGEEPPINAKPMPGIIGEEPPATVTTLATGEEGGDDGGIVVTDALGEAGIDIPNEKPPKNIQPLPNLPNDEPPTVTTLATGEEGGDDSGIAITEALGEIGFDIPDDNLIIASKALGEDGDSTLPNKISQLTGEDGNSISQEPPLNKNDLFDLLKKNIQE